MANDNKSDFISIMIAIMINSLFSNQTLGYITNIRLMRSFMSLLDDC